jgi:hypothetical protein
MKYNVVQNVSSNMVIKSTWDDKAKAKQAYHDTLRLLYSDAATTSGVVAILDDNLDVVDGCKEFIVKE